jgi:hypothetical protein
VPPQAHGETRLPPALGGSLHQAGTKTMSWGA